MRKNSISQWFMHWNKISAHLDIRSMAILCRPRVWITLKAGLSALSTTLDQIPVSFVPFTDMIHAEGLKVLYCAAKNRFINAIESSWLECRTVLIPEKKCYSAGTRVRGFSVMQITVVTSLPNRPIKNIVFLKGMHRNATWVMTFYQPWAERLSRLFQVIPKPPAVGLYRWTLLEWFFAIT